MLVCNPCTVPLARLMDAGFAASLENIMLNIGKPDINGCRTFKILIIVHIVFVNTSIINGCRWAVQK